MYTILVRYESGSHWVTTTTSPDVLNAVLAFYKQFSAAASIVVFYPNHQATDLYVRSEDDKSWTKTEKDIVP